MKKVVSKFDRFADAELADQRYYLCLTPQQRLDILLELVAAYRESQDEAAEGFARVCRIVERPRR